MAESLENAENLQRDSSTTENSMSSGKILNTETTPDSKMAQSVGEGSGTSETVKDTDIVSYETGAGAETNKRKSKIIEELVRSNFSQKDLEENKILEGDGMLEVHGQAQSVHLQLTYDTLLIQREELVYTRSQTDNVDPSVLAKERMVVVQREPIGGLGLSVKGGAEHNLPVLVSRIFKDQAADKTGQLFVGDAITQVNEVTIDNFTHDEAVQTLKNAGHRVVLKVKYFRPASLFLSKNKSPSNSTKSETDADNNPIQNGLPSNGETEEESNTSSGSEPPWHAMWPSLEKQWTVVSSIPLLCAHLTRYQTGSDYKWANGFEVTGYDGSCSGVIHCKDNNSLLNWVQSIRQNIENLNQQSITLTNKTLVKEDHVHYMCWVCERVGATPLLQSWRKQFLTLKGQDACIYDSPPVQTHEWVRYQCVYKIAECMLQVLKSDSPENGRQHCCLLKTDSGKVHHLAVECREEVLALEKAWHRANYHAVKQLGSRTFGCKWRGRLSGLTLDLDSGFSLYDSENKSYMWSYRFSQLKGSSDDGVSILKLHFFNEDNNCIDMREVDCTALQELLFGIHSFLLAKLASVDPNFLASIS